MVFWKPREECTQEEGNVQLYQNLIDHMSLERLSLNSATWMLLGKLNFDGLI
jgi:hypothetical protein